MWLAFLPRYTRGAHLRPSKGYTLYSTYGHASPKTSTFRTNYWGYLYQAYVGMIRRGSQSEVDLQFHDGGDLGSAGPTVTF